MRRLTRGRAATDDEATAQHAETSEPVTDAADAQPGGSAVPADAAPTGEQPTAVLAPASPSEPAPGRDLPAGVDPAKLSSVPTSASRGRLRRRLRYLRAVREVLLRDLGGFYFEAHRSDGGAESHRRLLDVKAARLATLEGELRELEERLEEPHRETVLRQPGIGGTCPKCGELHPTDARFCSRCGTPLGGPSLAKAPSIEPSPTPASATGQAEPATTRSLWGRPKRLAEAMKAEEKDAPKADEKDATKAEEKDAPKAEDKDAPRAEANADVSKPEQKPAPKAEEQPAADEPAPVQRAATPDESAATTGSERS